MRKAPLILQITLVFLFASAAFSAEIEPAPTTFVTDRASIIDAGHERQLTALLQELEQKTGARILVLTVDTTDGQDIHSYAFDRANKWKLGTNRKSASALVVVAHKDRKYRFEVGYDWEHVLTDGYVGQLGRQVLVPRFKAGRFSQGIFEATALLAGKIAEDRNVELTGMPDIRQPTSTSPWVGLLLIGFLIVFMVLSRGRGSRSGLFWGILLGSMIGGGRGGGGFGGGFGSFGGGGGGGFGGGGAGGSW